MYPTFYFPLLFLLKYFHPFIYFIIIKKKQKQIYLKIIKIAKKYIIMKNQKIKNKMFSFIPMCLSGRSHRVTLFSSKHTKNNFLSLLLSVRPLASCDTYFQIIRKCQKNIKFQNIKNINICKQTSF